MRNKSKPGTIVVELNHSGIPDGELQPEEFSEQQLAVLEQLDPSEQKKIRRGCPIHVVDMETGKAIAIFNEHNVKPSDAEMNLLAKTILDGILKWRQDPENQKLLDELEKKA